MLTPLLKGIIKRKSTLLISAKQVPYGENTDTHLFDEYSFNEGALFDRFYMSLGKYDKIVSTPAYIKKHPWIYTRVSAVLQPTPCLGYVYPDIYHMLPNFMSSPISKVYVIIDSAIIIEMLSRVAKINITYEHGVSSKHRVPVSETFIKKIMAPQSSKNLLHIIHNKLEPRTVEAQLKHLTPRRLQKLLRNDTAARNINFLKGQS